MTSREYKYHRHKKIVERKNAILRMTFAFKEATKQAKVIGAFINEFVNYIDNPNPKTP